MASGIRAPAKINLTLEVLARRDEGYHGIRSVMVPLDLADTIDVVAADRSSVECDDVALDGDKNLALRALRAISDAAGRAIAARLVLRKHIPTQAGLGGGSSDAAAVLLHAMAGGFGALPALDWLAVARSLGSDVPFFLVQAPALVEGTGERVTALGAPPPWAVLLVKPPTGTSTADAYDALDARERSIRPRGGSVSLRCAEALQRGRFESVQELLSNDFHANASEDTHVRAAAEALQAAGARRALLAGSGSTVFALMETLGERDAVASRLRLDPEFTVIRTAFASAPAWRAEARG